jgi:hypothetical protein
LPPGAIIELLEFTQRTFPIVTEIQWLFRGGDPTSISPSTLAEIVNRYEQLTNEEQHVVVDEDHIIPVIADRLSHFIAGFQKLNTLGCV